MTRLKVFTGNANPDLAKEICAYLCIPLGSAVIKRFSDGEVNVEIRDNVRGVDVFIIQPTCPPVNDHLMELLILMDGLKRASAKRVTAVLPYYGYARQDRKVLPRAPITAKLVADLLTAAGVSGCLRWISTRDRSRGSSTSRWTTFTRRRCSSSTSRRSTGTTTTS